MIYYNKLKVNLYFVYKNIVEKNQKIVVDFSETIMYNISVNPKKGNLLKWIRKKLFQK